MVIKKRGSTPIKSKAVKTPSKITAKAKKVSAKTKPKDKATKTKKENVKGSGKTTKTKMIKSHASKASTKPIKSAKTKKSVLAPKKAPKATIKKTAKESANKTTAENLKSSVKKSIHSQLPPTAYLSETSQPFDFNITEVKPSMKTTKPTTATAAKHPHTAKASEIESLQSLPHERKDSQSIFESMMHYKFAPYNPKPGEEYMSDEQLKHFKGILDTWKRELMKEVDHTISEMKGATVLADPNDRATQEEAFNLELRTRDRERKLIRKIEEALQQIEDKEYGYCESCGVEIGIRRLEARPTAGLCIDCKTLAEIRERNTQ